MSGAWPTATPTPTPTATPELKMEVGTRTAYPDWETVALENTYENPVVACAVNYASNDVPVVARDCLIA